MTEQIGTKLIDILENNQAYYNTAYVVGATKEQYEGYLIQEEEDLKESQRITDRFTD